MAAVTRFNVGAKQVFGAVSIQNNKAPFYSVQEGDLMFTQTRLNL